MPATKAFAALSSPPTWASSLSQPRFTVATKADAQVEKAVCDVDAISRVDGRQDIMAYLETRQRAQVETLDFVGHGDDGELIFSADLRFDDTTVSALFPTPMHPTLKSGPLTYGASAIRLLGCSTGCTASSLAAMRTIKERLNVEVYGSIQAVDASDFGDDGFKSTEILKEIDELDDDDTLTNGEAVKAWSNRLPALPTSSRDVFRFVRSRWPRSRQRALDDVMDYVTWVAHSRGLLSRTIASISEFDNGASPRHIALIGNGHALRIDPAPSDNIAPPDHSIIMGLGRPIPGALARAVGFTRRRLMHDGRVRGRRSVSTTATRSEIRGRNRRSASGARSR